MFTLIRTFLRYAGRIGWYDGRRDYPGDEHYQEMVLHAPALSDFEHKQAADPQAAQSAIASSSLRAERN